MRGIFWQRNQYILETIQKNSLNVLLWDVCVAFIISPRHGDSVSLKDLLSVIGHRGLSFPVR